MFVGRKNDIPVYGFIIETLNIQEFEILITLATQNNTKYACTESLTKGKELLETALVCFFLHSL